MLLVSIEHVPEHEEALIVSREALEPLLCGATLALAKVIKTAAVDAFTQNVLTDGTRQGVALYQGHSAMQQSANQITFIIMYVLYTFLHCIYLLR